MNKQTNIHQSILPTQLNSYQQLFSFFDKEDTGYIPMTNVGSFIRAVGHYPTQKEMSQILQSFGAPDKKQVSFNELVQFLAKTPRQTMIEQKIIDALNILNNPNSQGRSELMPINLFRKPLQQFGQRLSQQQNRQFIEFLNSKDLKVGQHFNYKTLCRILAYAYLQV